MPACLSACLPACLSLAFLHIIIHTHTHTHTHTHDTHAHTHAHTHTGSLKNAAVREEVSWGSMKVTQKKRMTSDARPGTKKSKRRGLGCGNGIWSQGRGEWDPLGIKRLSLFCPQIGRVKLPLFFLFLDHNCKHVCVCVFFFLVRFSCCVIFENTKNIIVIHILCVYYV